MALYNYHLQNVFQRISLMFSIFLFLLLCNFYHLYLKRFSNKAFIFSDICAVQSPYRNFWCQIYYDKCFFLQYIFTSGLCIVGNFNDITVWRICITIIYSKVNLKFLVGVNAHRIQLLKLRRGTGCFLSAMFLIPWDKIPKCRCLLK